MYGCALTAICKCKIMRPALLNKDVLNRCLAARPAFPVQGKNSRVGKLPNLSPQLRENSSTP